MQLLGKTQSQFTKPDQQKNTSYNISVFKFHLTNSDSFIRVQKKKFLRASSAKRPSFFKCEFAALSCRRAELTSVPQSYHSRRLAPVALRFL